MKIGLIGCVHTKLDTPAPARDLYTSPLFKYRRLYVETFCHDWGILSAKHGLLLPDQVVEPYEEKLKPQHAENWALNVRRQLLRQWGPLDKHEWKIHAGLNYRKHLPVYFFCPVVGMGLGEQLHFYKATLSAYRSDQVQTSVPGV